MKSSMPINLCDQLTICDFSIFKDVPPNNLRDATWEETAGLKSIFFKDSLKKRLNGSKEMKFISSEFLHNVLSIEESYEDNMEDEPINQWNEKGEFHPKNSNTIPEIYCFITDDGTAIVGNRHLPHLIEVNKKESLKNYFNDEMKLPKKLQVPARSRRHGIDY